MSRGALKLGPMSTGTVEMYIDGHGINSVDIVITGTLNVDVEVSNSSSAGANALWTTYPGMSGRTSASTNNSANYYSYEKIRIKRNSGIGTATLYFCGFSQGE